MVSDVAPEAGAPVVVGELPDPVAEEELDPELDPDEVGETPPVEEASEPEVAVDVDLEVAVLAADDEVELGVSKVSGQVRLKRGVVDRLLVIAKLCLLAPLESRRLYQKVGVLLKRRRQPTSCQ